jgi:hypothetical protein
VGPIVTLWNIKKFLTLLKQHNTRAYRLFIGALLKNPGRIGRLFISIYPPLYRMLAIFNLKLNHFKRNLWNNIRTMKAT